MCFFRIYYNFRPFQRAPAFYWYFFSQHILLGYNVSLNIKIIENKPCLPDILHCNINTGSCFVVSVGITASLDDMLSNNRKYFSWDVHGKFTSPWRTKVGRRAQLTANVSVYFLKRINYHSSVLEGVQYRES